VFPREEFAGRLERLRAAMRSRSVDVMLLDDAEILAYFTGYETSLNRYRACLVPAEGEPVMVLRALDAEPFRSQAWFDACVPVADTENPLEKVAAVLRPFAAIGFDPGSHALTVGGFDELRQLLPQARFVPMRGVPWELRLIKSAAEIALIRTAAGILDRTMREVIHAVEPGATCRALLALAAKRLLESGADPAHLGYVAAARGANFLHMRADESALEKGDVLHLELVSRCQGYEARVMRCIALGALEPARQRAAEQLAALQEQQIAAMKPGAIASDVDAILRQGVVDAGLREDYANITGYTLGYYSRQPLRSSDFTRCFMPGARWRLEPGMVFHMYTSASGVSFSETVLVADAGPERLTKLDRRLFVSA